MGSDTQPELTVPDEGQELLDLNVKEVSLVGKPAIRRKFVVTKQDDAAAEPPPGDGTSQATSTLVSKDVAKAAVPLLTALAEEKLSVVGAKVDAIVAALNSGTLTTDACWMYFDAIYSMLYKVENDVRTIAQVMQVPEGVSVTKSLAPEKRVAVEAVLQLLKSTEEKMAETTSQSTTAPAQSTAQEAITKAVTDAIGPAVTLALKPFEDRLEKLEKAAQKPAETTPAPVAKAETPVVDVAKQVQDAITAALAPIVESVKKTAERVDALAATPATPESNTTETNTQKGEPKDGSADFWGPAFAVVRS